MSGFLQNDWWNVQVKPYIFFSTPGGVDYEVWQKLKPIQHVMSAYGGLMANAVFAILAGVLIFAVGYVYLLTIVPEAFRVFVAVWNVTTVISMCVGRIVFTSVAKRKNAA